MPINPQTTEHYHLSRVADLYANNRISTPELKRAIEHVLRGGYIDTRLNLRSPLMDRVRTRRKQLACRHDGDLIDISGLNGPRYICALCGMDSTPWLDDIRPNRHTHHQRRKPLD